MAVYGVIFIVGQYKDELSPVCRSIGRGILFDNGFLVITYTKLIHGKNQWNHTRKDNFNIRNSCKNRTSIR